MKVKLALTAIMVALLAITLAVPASAEERLAAGTGYYGTGTILVSSGHAAMQPFVAAESGTVTKLGIPIWPLAPYTSGLDLRIIEVADSGLPALGDTVAVAHFWPTAYFGWRHVVEGAANEAWVEPYDRVIVKGHEYVLRVESPDPSGSPLYWNTEVTADYTPLWFGASQWNDATGQSWHEHADQRGVFAIYVNVPTPKEQITDLIAEVEETVTAPEPQLDAGLGTALTAKLDSALASLAADDKKEAANKLGAAINQAEAQTGKKIPEDLAQEWIAKLKEIQAALESEP